MNEDNTARNLRAELVLAAVQRAPMAIRSDNEGVECVAVGRVVRVSLTHTAIQTSREKETAVPLAAITSVTRLNEPREVENIEVPTTREG